jgi:hypothetical protein
VLVDRKAEIRAYHVATDLDAGEKIEANLQTLLGEK